MNKIKTSEMVSEGHPDKIADYLSDSVVDWYLERDCDARVACETLIKDNHVIYAGEITSKTNEVIPLKSITENALVEIGYVGEYSLGDIDVHSFIGKQSPNIASGVNSSFDSGDIGAGDQGIVFGYATNDTKELLPLPYILSINLLKKLKELRISDKRFGPDAKSQVSIQYNDSNYAEYCTSVVLSTQHSKTFKLNELRECVLKNVIKPVLGRYYTEKTKVFINPAGEFIIGGPFGDCGLTGRKIVVDQYGGFAPVGGGAFSSKDPSKVDRSACYFARWVAAQAVKNHYADEVLIEVAYSIGVSKPVAINITCNRNTSKVNEFVKSFDFTPSGIIKQLDLKRPIYRESVNYGHFTNKNLPWNQF